MVSAAVWLTQFRLADCLDWAYTAHMNETWHLMQYQQLTCSIWQRFKGKRNLILACAMVKAQALLPITSKEEAVKW